MIENLLYNIVEWIGKVYEMMDGIVLIYAGDLSESDISLFDVFVSLTAIAAIIHLIFDMDGTDWDDDNLNDWTVYGEDDDL